MLRNAKFLQDFVDTTENMYRLGWDERNAGNLSILIDEARTPLIISGQSGKSTKLYEACDILARQLQRGKDVEFSAVI